MKTSLSVLLCASSTLSLLSGTCFGHGLTATGHTTALGAYDTLKNLYDTGTAPAAMSDFDLATFADPTQKCVISTSADKNSINPIYSRHFQNVVAPGIPSNGPLFPGVPDRNVDECLVLGYSILDQSEVTATCANEAIQTTSSDLQIFYPNLSDSSTDDGSVISTTLNIRQNSTELAIRLDQITNVQDPASGTYSPVTYTSYAYCYR